MLLDTDDESNDDMLGERNHRSFKNRHVDIHGEVKEDMNDSLDSGADCSIFSEFDDPGRFTNDPNIFLAKITLLHTKSKDRKPRV
jgi:hypothetical protein